MAVNINGDTGIDKVQPGSVDGVDLTDGSVTEGKIGTGAVTADKIGSGAVTSAKLENNISVPGTVTATSFVGSGASLTGIAGGFSNMEVFTSSGTWTNPGNITKVKVIVTAGGGGSGGPDSASNPRATGGGGGGGTAIKIVSFPSATNVPVTVGSGGTPTNPVQGKANDGGTSSFGAYCSATGGGGSYGGDTPSSPFRGAGGNPGSGSGGDLNISGGNGGDAIHLGSPQPANMTSGAYGGGTYWGPGGAGYFKSAAGGIRNNAQGGLAYGSGSGGRDEGGTAGNGAPGVVIVEY